MIPREHDSEFMCMSTAKGMRRIVRGPALPDVGGTDQGMARTAYPSRHWQMDTAERVVRVPINAGKRSEDSPMAPTPADTKVNKEIYKKEHQNHIKYGEGKYHENYKTKNKITTIGK